MLMRRQSTESRKSWGTIKPEILPQVVVNGPKIVPVAESDKRIVDAVNVADIVSLKKAIEAQKRIIGQLKTQVREMRDGLAS